MCSRFSHKLTSICKFSSELNLTWPAAQSVHVLEPFAAGLAENFPVHGFVFMCVQYILVYIYVLFAAIELEICCWMHLGVNVWQTFVLNISTYIHIYIYVYPFVFVYIYAYIYICICTYIHIHIYIYIHVYTCTYTHIYVHICVHI